MEKPIGLYIHVPFCLSKCPYCDFYSVKASGSECDGYVSAICRAIQNSPQKGRIVDTIYFGGGTPVLLGAKRLSDILDAAAKYFCFSDPEITLEVNPAAIPGRELAGLRAAGFNRISFGVQSGIDTELKALGRLHSASVARDCILAARKAGFSNISADLMLGIPHQTRESLGKSISFLTGLQLSHVSAYMLKIEENTEFKRQNKAALCPDENILAEMYLDCVKSLNGHGFIQYEISNFAKNDAISRHNLKYWTCGEYLGLGPSAHSFIGGSRFYLPRDLNAFINAENPLSLRVLDGEGGGFDEYAMLRLRLCEGLDLKQTAALYGVDTSNIAEKARALERNRLVKTDNGVISLTPEGFLLSNTVTAALLYMRCKRIEDRE